MERRLAAIPAADVVGYPRLIGEDEAATLAAINAHRKGLLMHCLRWFATYVFVAAVSAVLHLQAAYALEPPHHDIQLRINPDQRTISIRDRITVSGRRSITIRVADWMPITDLGVDGRSVQERTSNTSVFITLPSLGKHRIDVAARGVIPKLDLEKAVQLTGFGAIASGDGVYLPNSAYWYPQVSNGTATYRLTVVTPVPYRAAASGTLQSEDLGERDNTAVFESQMLLGLPTVFVGPYMVAEKRSGALRIRTYFYQSAAGLAQSYLDAAEGYIRMFEQEIGPYPFDDFHIVSAPLPVGPGFPNMTYVDRRILRLPFMRGRSLAHEVLHNWWGNGVQTDYEAGNWSEGLTTYMADHALAEQGSPQAGREMRLGWLRDYAALPEDRGIPVTRFVSKQHDATQVVGYGKVAFIFHMLKHEIGPDRFSTAIKRFWKANRFTTAGWPDIRAAFEVSTKTDLGWFFRQWTERAGAPRLTLEDARVLRRGEGYVLEIALAQAEPAYRLKVPVRVKTDAGERQFDIRLDDKSAKVQLQLDAKPVGFQIDPDHTLFRRLLPGEAPPILRDILLDTRAKTLVLQEDPVSQQLARELVGRLFDGSPNFLAGDPIPKMMLDEPLLVLGSAEQIDHLIALTRLPACPLEISGRGTGRAWTARKKGGKAVLFVEADNVEALRSMTRLLPHYRSKSYIIFEKRRAVAQGVWSTAEGPLTRMLN